MFAREVLDVGRDVETLEILDTAEDDWIEAALAYLRHQTFHYGAKTNWKALRWAMRTVADEEGEMSE